MLKFYFCLFFFIVTLTGKAQFQNLKSYTFNLKFHKGFILMHNSDVAHLANQHPTIMEIDVYRQTDGSKLWHQLHRYPTIGYSLNFVIMDPHKPLGNMASVVAYISKPLVQTSKSRLELRIGVGPSYAGRVFDLQQNPKNIMMSSHLNFCLNGRINYSFSLGKWLNVNTGIGIIHFSNGTVKLPNQGINIPSVHLGFGWNGNARKKYDQDSVPHVKKKLKFEIMAALGVKEEYPIFGKKFIATTISAYVSKNLNHKSKLQLGLDLFYDPTVVRALKDLTIPFGKKTKAAIVGGHELAFGKLSLLTQVGVYVYDPYKLNVAFYERYGLKYRICKNLFAQLSMKIYFGSVDYVEWGIGYRI